MSYRAGWILVLAFPLVSCEPSAEPKKGGETPAAPKPSASVEAAKPAPAAPATAEGAIGAPVTAAAPTKSGAAMTKTASGLEYAVLKEGQGAPPPRGSVVKVQGKGWLADGRVIWSTSPNAPKEYRLDAIDLIPGWFEALSSMKAGEKRKLRVPGRLGYKTAGYGTDVPPNADLDFELELVSFKAP